MVTAVRMAGDSDTCIIEWCLRKRQRQLVKARDLFTVTRVHSWSEEAGKRQWMSPVNSLQFGRVTNPE
jgi:hypothetical protein